MYIFETTSLITAARRLAELKKRDTRHIFVFSLFELDSLY